MMARKTDGAKGLYDFEPHTSPDYGMCSLLLILLRLYKYVFCLHTGALISYWAPFFFNFMKFLPKHDARMNGRNTNFSISVSSCLI